MKKRTRQILSLLIAAAMLCPLIACSKAPSDPNEFVKPQGFKEGTAMLTGTTYEPSYSRDDVPDALSRSTIVADKTSGGLCLSDTSFTLTPSGDTTPAEILSYLTTSPKIDLSCTEDEDGTFKLTPSTALLPNTVYRLSFGGENPISSFAFQTENVFALDSAFPADLATDVPVDIGIELRFTEAVTPSVRELGEYIKLTPSEEGEFILYPDRKTVVFAPKNKLQTNTVYTVEISSDITGVGGKSLGEDVTVKFRTSASEVDKSTTKVTFRFTNSMPVFAPEDAMYLAYNMSYSGNGTSKDFTHKNTGVKVFKYATAEDAVDAMRDFLEVSGDYYFNDEIYKYPTKGLQLVLDTEITPTTQGSGYYSARYLDLPTLDEGIYLVCVTPTVSVGNTDFSSEMQALLQVSDYAVYTESSADTLVWINSVTGKDTSGISVKAELFRASDGWDTDEAENAYTTVNVKTNSDGIAIIDTSLAPEANRAFITVDNSLIVCASGINKAVKTAEYAAWIYTDRDTYFSSDRVNFTGVISTLDGSLPEYVYLTTSLSYGKQKLEVTSDGYFSGSFEFEDFAAGYRSMIRMNFTDEDGNTVKSTYVHVTAEDKPVYTASLSFDRIFYEFGDRGKLTLTSSFFDGTPAPGLTFEIYLPFVGNRTVITDESGKAEIDFTCGRYQTGSTSPSTIYASAYLSGYEGSTLEVGASTVYFQSENHLRIEKGRDSDEITVRLNKFDTSPIKSAEDLAWGVFPDNCIGEAAQGSISVTLKKITYVRTEGSSQYNPITKKVEKSYYYRAVESTVSTNTYSFKEGVVTLPCFEREDDCSYYYVIKYYDARNTSTVQRSIGAVKYTDTYRFDYGDYFSLESSHDYDDYAAAGDVVEYTLKYGGKTAYDTKILHTVHTATSDLRKYYDITSGGFSLEYTKEYVYGVRVLSVVFDGKNYTTLWVRTPTYDYKRENSLEITITPASDSYKPGETCIVEISARTANGNPASGGVITLGVVDEACFKLGEQTLNPTGVFFSVGSSSPAQNTRFNCFSKQNYYDRYYTMTDDMEAKFEAATEAPTEAGGTKLNSAGADFDSVTVREFFADNPVFENVRLDENGCATVSFTVPDNITSWRITAVGYTPSADAESVRLGHAKTDVIATLPFFINATLSDTYVVGDDISATARVFGTATVTGEVVSYLAELSDYDGSILRTETLTEKAGEYAHFNLDKLEAGSYSLTVKAICGEYSDGVKLSFSVVPDGITMETRRTLKADEISSLSPTLYPVRLSFVNANFSDYLDVVYYVNSKGYNRTDTLAARYVSLTALSKIFGTSYDKELDRISSAVRTNYTDGLISLMSYSEGDLILSAKIAALVPEIIPANRKAELIDTFKTAVLDQTYQTNEELAACLLGLSALGEPVLVDVYTLAACDLSDEAKLYLSSALALLGDYSASRELYDIATDGKLEGEYEINVKASTTEDRIRLTALALMTASYVDRDSATPMARYIMSHTSTLDVYSLEMTAYVKNFYPIGAVDASFSYSVGDEVHEITLKPAQVHSLTLGKAAFESLEVSAGDDVLVLASYVSGVTEALRDTDEASGARITKTVEPHDISRGLYKVKISYEITFDSNYECYTLTDRIPSGARYYGAYEEKIKTSVTDRYSYAYISNDGGQMMHGYIGMYNPTEKYIEGRDERTVYGEVTYLIRAAVSGEFALSPAIIRNCKNGEYALSGGGSVTIGENSSVAWKIKIKD